MWDLATGVCERVLEGHTGPVNSVACHPDGVHALSGDIDGTVRVWDLASGACERVLEGHTGSVNSVAYHPDGAHALSGDIDGKVRVWDLATGAGERVLEGHTGSVLSVAYHPDGGHALSGGHDRTVRVWDLASGACERVLEGHTGPVDSVAYHPDGAHALSGGVDRTVRVWNLASGACEGVLEGHTDMVFCVGYHPDGGHALSGGGDRTVRVWDLASGACERVLEGHTGSVLSVAYHPDGAHALSGGDDRTVRVWNLASGACERVLEGHAGSVLSVAYHPDGAHALSGGVDRTVRVWNLASGACEGVLEGHTDMVFCVGYHPDGGHALSGGGDNTVRVWDLASGACERVLEGHAGSVLSVAYHPDGAHALSGGVDRTVRVWDLASGACERILEGHTESVHNVAYHPDGARALSGGSDETVRVWDMTAGACERVLEGHSGWVHSIAYHPDGSTVLSAAGNGVLRIWPAELIASFQGPSTKFVTYSNAKVVLVGESQAGKSGLAMRLAHDRWEHSESTVGAWATWLPVRSPAGPGNQDLDREIWLWDFGGQADQRLIHQLYLGDAALAVLVFDGQRDDVVARLWDWNRALASSGRDYPRILVAARTDINPVRLSTDELEEFRDAAGFGAYVETSAKDDVGCHELRDVVLAAIDWSRVPWRSSPQTFRRLKQEILALRDSGRVLTSVKVLRDWLAGRVDDLRPEELDAVIGLLAGPGAVMPLDFGDYVLLQPELLNAYAQAVIRSFRDDPQERGCILEERVLAGDLAYPSDFVRLPQADEAIVLRAMHKQLVERAICLRDQDPKGKRPTTLVFPSYFRRERPDRPTQPIAFMTYSFDGYLDEVYATLVVRLHHTEPFTSAELWRNAADFTTLGGNEIGIRLVAKSDGTGALIHLRQGPPLA